MWHKYFTCIRYVEIEFSKSINLTALIHQEVGGEIEKDDQMGLSEGAKKRKAKKAVKGIKSKPTAAQARARAKAGSIAKARQSEHGGRAHRRRNG